MVPLDGVMTSFYKLSTVTISLSAVVWPQFWMRSCCLQPSPTCAKLQHGILALTVTFNIAMSP